MFPAQSQDKRTNNMEILRDKIKADKKLLVATNMELTESEATKEVTAMPVETVDASDKMRVRLRGLRAGPQVGRAARRR